MPFIMHDYIGRRMLAICLAILAIGCSKGPPVGDVYGEVTLDEKPVAEGSIRFAPIDEQAATAGALIVDGKFHALVPVSNHRVQISAAQLPPGGMTSRHEAPVTITELIPEKYNTKSELTLDVKAGRNEPQFHLKSH